ncbi:hypothetical protein FB384_004909 [Prauserella sediminis]|uniref:Terminase large subunit gp17-like C-terminal domain-containing protein n=1 Tax=Prauserella sediminis TaxID=577680 RepID=A0A839XRZ6_9PSEU|nr:hypothetical protein [Prauserella sediminis]MBB3665950.1 hypothetical protein [Prauserella sediminis]
MISIGLDVGREHDPAALGVLHSGDPRPNSHRPHWSVLEIGNIELGTEYLDLAKMATSLAGAFHAAGHQTVLSIDATGIGAAVVEMARRNRPGLHICAITIGSSRTLARTDEHDYTVGKHRLTETLQVALEQSGISLPDSDGGVATMDQLRRFARRPTRSGYHKHEAASGHDDLVLALELALWTGDTLHDEYAGVRT